MRFEPVREARCGSCAQKDREHCSPHADKGQPGSLHSLATATHERQLCPPLPQERRFPGSLRFGDGRETGRMEAGGEQDHRETKFALPQGAFLPGLPRFASPGQPVHVLRQS